MKRILILSKSLESGGAERQLFYLASYLKKSNAVDFLVYKRSGVFLDKLEALGIGVYSFTKRSLIKDSFSVETIVRKGKYDVVVSYLPELNLVNEIAALFGRFRFKKWRVIVGARSSNPAFVKSFKLRFYYFAHIFSDAIISNSESNKREILLVNKLLKEKKIHVIYNIFQPESLSADYLPFRNDRINMVVAANYRMVKNLDGLLCALSLLDNDQRSKIHIDWYGIDVDGSLDKGNQFIENNSLSEVISLHQSSDEIYLLYQQADIVGLFSHYEGLPNSICEALYLGKMVICTPVSDMPLLLKDTGNIICGSDLPDDIFLGLSNLINLNKETVVQVGKSNCQKFAQLFYKDKIERELESVVLG